MFAIVGPKAAWIAGRGRRLDEITDGTDQTLLLIEATGQGVNWLEPKDLSYEEALSLLTADNVKQAAVVHADERLLHYTEFSRNVVTADAQAGRLPIGCSEGFAEKLLTIDGGEELDSSLDWRGRGWSTESRLHWPRIWGIAVFVVLAALPWALTLRRRKWIEEPHRQSRTTA